MRWKKRTEWGPRTLGSDEWAVLEAQIRADDLAEVEQAVEELTGFMDFFRADLDGAPLTGMTDGQLAVVQRTGEDRRGRRVHAVTFYAAGAVGQAQPHAFDRLGSSASELVDYLQSEGVGIAEITWTEHPYVKRAF